MKTMLHAAFAAGLAHVVLADVKVTIGEVHDYRTTDKAYPNFHIELRLRGSELADATGVRATVKSATDDTGMSLGKLEHRFCREGHFEELQKASDASGDKNAGVFQVRLEFPSPPRATKTIKTLEGTIELLIPSKDPAAVITASVAKDAGKPLENAALKAAGVEFSFLKPGEREKRGHFTSAFCFGGKNVGNEFHYDIKDPKNNVASVEFFDSTGKKLKSNGRMSSGEGELKTVTVRFETKPPADASAKICLMTDKSVLTVPLALKDIALP